MGFGLCFDCENYGNYFYVGTRMLNIAGFNAHSVLIRVGMLGLQLALVSTFCAASPETVLINEAEAVRPNAPELSTRGISRGPGIKLIGSPEIIAKSFNLKFEFEPRGGARIDAKSIRLEYLKQPLIDLTDRVKAGIHDQTLELERFSVPPGAHALRIRVSDSEGREATQVVNLQAK